jgi:hypothetical protein
MATKPSSSPDWTLTNPSVRQEPTSGKKNTGWGAGEKPPRQFMNWLFFNLSEWKNYFEEVTDDLQAVTPNTLSVYRAIVGTGGTATHATLQAAFSDAAVVPGSRIFVMANHAETLTTQMQCAKNDITVECGPGVTFTQDVTPITALRVTGLRFVLLGGRFVNFSKAISVDNVSNYAKIKGSFFNACGVEVEDLTTGQQTIISETFTE